MIYPVEKAQAMYDDTEYQYPVDLNVGIALNTKTGYTSATLPVYVPKNNYALLTLFNVPGNDKDKVTVSSVNLTNINTYQKYLDGENSNSQLDLKDGLNIILVENANSAINLNFTVHGTTGEASSDHSALVKILSVKLVRITEDIKTGLNYNIFDINPTKDIPTGHTHKSNFFNIYLKEFADNNEFLATIDIDNSILLDIDKFSNAYTLFNYNNEVNKFVLAELDWTSFNNIEIASSSKLN